MAKVVNGGNKKGKLGNSIFYTIKNSNNKVTQGERIYQPSVTNPQSDSQRAQRMKMTPASNFYRALSGILDHSWEGVKYGAMSRQYFMKLAMSANQTIFPYVLRGTTFVVPGPYPISRGSLPSVGWEIKNNELFINANTSETVNPTIDNISKALIARNPFLREGDQITIILMLDLEERATRTYLPVVNRFLIDTSNTAELDTELSGIETDTFDNDGLSFISTGFTETASLAGACVVVSRKSESTGQVWLRSTEVMAVTDALLNEYMSPNAYAAALASYQRVASVAGSDYYLNDAETPSEANVANYSFTNQQLAYTFGAATGTMLGVCVQDDNGGVATCAEYGFFADERPDKKTAYIQPYTIRGREIIKGDMVPTESAQGSTLLAKFNDKNISVLKPADFVARFTDIVIG